MLYLSLDVPLHDVFSVHTHGSALSNICWLACIYMQKLVYRIILIIPSYTKLITVYLHIIYVGISYNYDWYNC